MPHEAGELSPATGGAVCRIRYSSGSGAGKRNGRLCQGNHRIVSSKPGLKTRSYADQYRTIRTTRTQHNIWLGIVLSSATILTGCGGGSSSGTGTTTTPTTPDMGTLTAVSDSYQYKLMNASSGLVLGISGQSQVAGAYVVQESDSGTTDALWHFMPMNNDEYNVENLLTHQVLGILNASTSAGAQALQYSDNGTDDHLWEFYLLSDRNYLIKNGNSGYFLEDAGSGTTSSATIDQGARAATGTGCTCQEWTLASTGTSPYTAPLTVAGTGIYVHDPYMLQDPTTHYYWLYGTHQTLAYSTDLSTFTYTSSNSQYGACTTSQGTYWLTDGGRCPIIGPDFPSWTGLQTPPSDNGGENIDTWAPSLLYANSTYYLYYAIPYEPSTGAEAVIGLATSATPYGPWKDKGYVVPSWTGATTNPPSANPWGFVDTTTYNAIDPVPFVDASGNWWMSFGSWLDGIHLVALDPSTGLPVSSASSFYPIIAARGAGKEGSFIYPYIFNGTQYYYYFAPINVCCAGNNSTYRIIVGRSTSATGPYVDRGGIDLVNGGGTILLSAHGNINGPGGQSVFTDSGTDGAQSLPTLVYHYYDGNNNGTPTLGINRLNFTSDGWPYI
jgi:arabinan endo-1,5-alpha-L-arabinosidase